MSLLDTDESTIRDADEAATADRRARKRAVLVLGMHRSGTSAVTGTLERLGLGGPKSPVEPSDDNPAGFYESRVVVALNDRILKALGSTYDDWLGFDPAWLDGLEGETFVTETGLRYLEEYGRADVAAVKDPRISRLVPLWRRALDRIGVETQAVLVFRSPLEVASSLKRRNGFLIDASLIIWLRHVLDAELHTRDLERCFVGMGDFLGDWRSAVARIADALRLHWPRDERAAATEIDGYLSPSLRHHVSAPQDLDGVHPWVADALGALQELVADPYARQPMATLDRIRSQFQAASDLFSSTTHAGYAWARGVLEDHAALRTRSEEAEKRARDTIGKLESEAEAQRLAVAGWQARSRTADAATAARDDAIRHLNAEQDRMRHALAVARREILARRELDRGDRLRLEARSAETLRAEREQSRLAVVRERRAARASAIAAEKAAADAATAMQIVADLSRGSDGTIAAYVGGVRRSLVRMSSRPARQERNPHFDEAWYVDRYPDVSLSGLDPYEHYLEHGAAQGRDPSASFDTRWYRARYADVREAGVNPLIHYWQFGHAEGRLADRGAVNPFFDDAWYRARYGADHDIGAEAYAHYLRVGSAAGLDPSPDFSTRAYLDAYPDIRATGIDPLVHYWRSGEIEGRRVERSVLAPEPEPASEGGPAEDEVDPAWYLARYADVREAGADPERHYRESGRFEGRLPNAQALNPHFDEDWYRAQYGADHDLGPEPYSHYRIVGALEGFDPSPDFHTDGYRDAHPDVAASGANPLDHYWREGAREGRTTRRSPLAPNPKGAADPTGQGVEFDPEWYRARYADIAEAGVDPAAHYAEYGEAEGRRPNAVFDPVFYRDLYPDAAASGVSPFTHYRTVGAAQGRLPRALEHRFGADAPHVLFVGHDSYAAGAQRVLLRMVDWFRRHTLSNISVLLLGPGHLTADYVECARTFVVGPDVSAQADAVRAFVGRAPDLVVCNTVVSGRVLVPELADVFASSKVIAFCHELGNVIGGMTQPFHALCRRADRWICASPAITALLSETPALEGRPLETLKAFIEPSRLSPPQRDALRARERAALGIGPDALVVLGCGTLHWRKDPSLFVRTALEVPPSIDGRDVHFVWVGDGEDAPFLEAMIDGAGRADRIKLMGYRADAGDLMCIGDVFFLSSMEDPFPLVVMEAGQFGLPAVCFEGATGMAELLAVGGRIVPERRPEAAAAALQELLEDEPLRISLGASLRDAILARHVPAVQMPRVLANIRATGLKPAVSIVVPNYNHADYLKQRLDSIFSQSMQDFEVIVLDDASQDASLSVIEAYRHDPRVRVVVNETNSGSPFAQWERGAGLARSDIVWIAESDDSCGETFLEILLPRFFGQKTNVAFGRTEIIDASGAVVPNALQGYLDRMEPGFGGTAFARSGASFVNAGFGAICTIANVSGALIRRHVLLRALAEARTYKMCGDWRVYLDAMADGSVAYEPDAVNYFRRHAASAVHRLEGTDLYFDERLRIARYVAQTFRTTPALRDKMDVELQHEATRFRGRYAPDLDLDLGRFFEPAKPRFLAKAVHVCFYVHGMLFSKGGIERLFAMISTALVERGFRVSLACASYADDERPIFPLYPDIEIVATNLEADSGVAALRRHLSTRGVDVFVPMLSEALFERAFEAAAGLGIPVIASEHNNPSQIEARWWSREGRLACFAKADAIHLVATEFAGSLPPALREKVTVIPHAVAPEFLDVVWQPSQPPTIVAVGRLATQKRFDLLIKAFAKLADDFPDWRLAIYGDGAERSRLSALVQSLDLTEQVSLPGTTSQLPGILSGASLFVLSSEFEATGLALVEALAVGVPCVGFAACEGNSEIIRDGETGLLAPEFTAASLARTMRRTMSDEDLRRRLGGAGRQLARERFRIEDAMDRWQRLILDHVAVRPDGTSPLANGAAT